MECTICESTNEVKQCDHIYTIGSEGTKLCLECRILVAELLRRIRNINARVKMDTIKKYR